jgi:hypothetical protein
MKVHDGRLTLQGGIKALIEYNLLNYTPGNVMGGM